MMYENLVNEIEKRGEINNLCLVRENFIKDLMNKNIDMPSSYINFLKEVGIFKFHKDGDIFQLFEGLFYLKDITMMETSEAFKDIVFFASDSNSIYGFHKAMGWKLVETDEYQETLTVINMDFSEFIERKIIYFLDCGPYGEADEEYENNRRLIWDVISGYKY